MKSSSDKVCSRCKVRKPLEKFNRRVHSSDGRASQCRQCYNDPEVKAARAARRLELMYGITQEEFDAMLEKQGGRCAICKNEMTMQYTYGGRQRRTLNVDHCHETGKVRGLLCTPCNQVLGIYNDDPELLKKAARYLEES